MATVNKPAHLPASDDEALEQGLAPSSSRARGSENKGIV
jgi:hypothetical protein